MRMRSPAAIAGCQLRLLLTEPFSVAILTTAPILFVALLSPLMNSTHLVAGMATLFALAYVTRTTLNFYREHDWGTWDRLRSLGISRMGIAVGLLTVPFCVIAVHFAVLFLTGFVFFGVQVRGGFLGLVLVGLAFALFVVGFSLMLFTLCISPVQAEAISSMLIVVLGLVGGCFAPYNLLPGWVRPIGPISPAYWAMEGFTAALNARGEPFSASLVIAGMALVCLTIGLARIRLDAPKKSWI